MRKAFVAALLMSVGSLAVPALAANQLCTGNNSCPTTENQGGEGGAGGAGIGIAGSESNAAAINHNANIAKGGTGVGISGSESNAAAINHNANVAKGGEANAGAVSGSVAGAAQKQKQGQHQTSTSVSESKSISHSSSDNANNASQSVNFEAQERAPVNTAYAAPLAAGEDTCMGSSSLGGQGVGFGLTIGTTWTDTNCQRLKNSRQLAALGYKTAAVALLCLDDDVATAMEAAGMPCRVKRQEQADNDDDRGVLTTAYITKNVTPDASEAPVAASPITHAVTMEPIVDVPSKSLRLRAKKRRG